LILPFVLQSAEVMKRAVAHLEQYFEKKEGYTKGRVVIATVFGDVHDIGKSLVNTILSNNGYTVFDLVKQVPVNVIIDKALEYEADAIGLSALLVNTSKQMPLCVQELHKRGLNFPVLIGGAAINRAFGYRIGFVEGENRYDPGVYYCKDAFEGLDTMEALTDPANREAFVEKVHQAAVRASQAEVAPQEAAAVRTERSPKIRTDNALPTPPFWGPGVLNKIPAEEVFAHLDLNTLFRLHWGGKGVHNAEWDALVAREFMPRLERMKRDMIAGRIIQPRVIYGYYPCASEGNQLVIFDPGEPQARREITRFDFPRQPDREQLCLADFFAPLSSGKIDVVGLQVVTVGDRAIDRYNELQAAGEYSEALFLHGLAVSTAEALAEYTQARMRRELGLEPEQGRRYSWGYPACPDIEEHAKLFQILPASDEIGVRLTTGFQLDPEASTAALVTHHPQSKYYTTRPVRQLRRNGGSAAPEATEERELVAPGVLAED
jgi:5-methyltetrahydrofolate--homocysteine methyltransferase